MHLDELSAEISQVPVSHSLPSGTTAGGGIPALAGRKRPAPVATSMPTLHAPTPVRPGQGRLLAELRKTSGQPRNAVDRRRSPCSAQVLRYPEHRLVRSLARAPQHWLVQLFAWAFCSQRALNP